MLRNGAYIARISTTLRAGTFEHESDIMDYNSDRLWKKLTKLSELSLCCVFAESAFVGAIDARSTARFVSYVGGTWGENVVYVFLWILYSLQIASAVALCVPAVTQGRIGRPSILLILSALATVESIVHVHSNDFGGLSKGFMMLMACVAQLLDTCSSRSHTRVNGMLDTRGYRDTVDAALGRLREVASRYRLGAHAAFLIAMSIVYTLGTAESLFSKSAIRNQLAKNQWSRLMSFIALCASIGANDRDTSLSKPLKLGRKKSL